MFLVKKMELELQNLLKKLKELKGTSKSIAHGFTTGVIVSFTPFVGFHLIIAYIITKLTHQSSVAAAIGTLAGNPWTFPLIWYITLHMGELILKGEISSSSIDFMEIFKELFHGIIMLDFHVILKDIWPIILPMMIGCIPFCIGIGLLLPKLILKVLQQGYPEGGYDNDNRVGM